MCLYKTTIMHTLHMKFFCMLMADTVMISQTSEKTMLHLEITNQQRMQMIEFGSLGNYKHVQHIMFFPYHTVIV